MSSQPQTYRYCPLCSSQLSVRSVKGKNHSVCSTCGWIHFRNPAVAAAVVIINGAGEILLIKRGPETLHPHRWSVPAGFVDFGEELKTAAQRETREETGLNTDIGPVLTATTNLDDPEKPTICVWFQATIVGGEMAPGDDATEVGFFAPDELPTLAFPNDMDLLNFWIEALSKNRSS